MNLLDEINKKRKTLSTTETIIKQVTTDLFTIDQQLSPTPPQTPFEGPRSVLFITPHWSIGSWVSNDMKKVLFCTQSTYDYFTVTYADKLNEIGYDLIVPFHDLTSGAVELKAMQLHEQFGFTHVVCVAEEQLIRCAKIREMLGIKHGQTVNSALDYRDKVVMKDKLSAAGVKVPNYAPVEYASDIISFINTNGYPVVIKPRKGYLSVSTYIIKNEEELFNFLNSGLNMTKGFDSAQDLMIEAFCYGQMHHIDGIVYENQIKCIWPSSYMNACANFAESEYLSSYTLNIKNPLIDRFRNFFADVISALDSPECFPFHGEAWITPDDEIVFCEIASRTGGAGVRHQIRELFNIVTDKTWTQWQCQDLITNETLGSNWQDRLPSYTYQVAWLFIYPKMGVLSAIPEECPFECLIEGSYKKYEDVGFVYSSRDNCVDAVASFNLMGNSDEEIRQNIIDVYIWFNQNTTYTPINQ